MPDKKNAPKDVAGQFSDEEMEGIKRYGQALGGGPTPFDEEVEKHLAGHEAHFAKMRAAQRGEGELGPSQFQEQQQKQTGALQQLVGSAGQQQAAQAQAGMSAPNAPPAPSGPAGVTRPFPAQTKPGAVPTVGKPPAAQPAPDQEAAPEEAEQP